MVRQNILIVLGSLAVVGLAACGGAAGVATSAAPAANGARASTVAPQSGAAQSGAPQSGAAQSGAAQSGAAAQAPASTAAKPPAGETAPTTTVPEGPRVQRSASITLQVPNGRFDGSLDDIIAIAEGAGGYISGQNAQAASQGEPLRSGQVTFQVPSAQFDNVVMAVQKKGTAQNVVISGNDVSQQYVDLQARLGNAESQRNAVLALMQQARSVNDTIQIENQLGQITSQIEQLKGQIAYIDHSTSYATVAVTIREEALAPPRDDWGLQTAGSQALHNLANVLAFLLIFISVAAPLLVAGGVAFVAGRMAWRRFWPRPSAGAAQASLHE
jgi:hypothetical protein